MSVLLHHQIHDDTVVGVVELLARPSQEDASNLFIPHHGVREFLVGQELQEAQPAGESSLAMLAVDRSHNGVHGFEVSLGADRVVHALETCDPASC